MAERAYKKKMVEWAEKKYLDIREDSNLTFSQLAKWFLELPVVRQNKTIKDIERSCRDLEQVFGSMLIKDIKPAMVEKYQHQRLQEPTRYGTPRFTANVNRTIAVLKRMFNLTVREELSDKNSCWKVKMLQENNVRDRILSVEELELLLRYLPPHAARVVHFAYLTGMRAGEIFNLTWDKVDLARELVRLGAEDTKTSEPRIVFLCGRAYDILKIAARVDLWITTGSSRIGKPFQKRYNTTEVDNAKLAHCRLEEIFGQERARTDEKVLPGCSRQEKVR